MLAKTFFYFGLIILSTVTVAFAGEMGQTIQIYTRFHQIMGKATWLLVIRDLDQNRNIPYLYDIRQGTNFWLAFTLSRNYVILASNLQITSYQPHCNQFCNRRIRNFCHLESRGRIIHGESMSITLTGALTPSGNNYNCNVSRYPDFNFTVVAPPSG